MSPFSKGNFLKQFIKFPTQRPFLIADPSPYEKVTIPRIHSFCQKILKLRRQNHNIELITDYDHTLTKYKHEGRRCDSLFGMWVKDKRLPQKFRQELLNNYLYYGPYQTDGNISFIQKMQLVNQLYHVQTKLFQNHKITVDMACKTIQDCNIVFRPFTKRLLEVLNEIKIPVYIISGGISDIIHTSIHDIYGQILDNISIHSNELQVYKFQGQNGDHVSVDLKEHNFLNFKQKTWKLESEKQNTNEYFIKFKKPIIHSLNKFQIMQNHTSKRKNCILMGDLQSDIYMARNVKYQTIFSIFYAKQGDTDQRAYAQDKFDLIVQNDGSHKIVVQLLKIIAGNKRINWEYLTSVHKNLHQYLI